MKYQNGSWEMRLTHGVMSVVYFKTKAEKLTYQKTAIGYNKYKLDKLERDKI